MRRGKHNPNAAWNPRAGGRILLRFTLSYFVLLLIPAALCVSAYFSAMRMAEQNVLEKHRLVLSHSLDLLKSSIAETERFTLTLSQMGDVVDAMQQAEPTDARALYAIRKGIDQLPVFRDANGLATGYFLYSSLGDYILAPSKAYINLERYYEQSLKYEGMGYAAWREAVLSMARVKGMLPAARHIQPNYASEVSITLLAPFVPSLAQSNTMRMTGKVIFFLSAQALLDTLRPALDMGAEQIFVLNREGTLLTSLADANGVEPALWPLSGREGMFRERVNGVDMVVTYQNSADAGLSAVILTPARAVLWRSSALLSTLLFSMLALLGVGGVFAYAVARRNRKPLAHIIERLPEGEGSAAEGMNTLWDIDRAVHRLTAEQERLEEKIRLQQTQMRTAFIHQVIGGAVSDEMELEALLKYIDPDIGGCVYRGVYMEVQSDIVITEGSLIQADLTQRYVLEALQAQSRRIHYLTMLDHARYILLYSAQEREDEHWTACFGELYRKLKTERGAGPRMFIGSACTELTALHKSFDAAYHLMDIHERNTSQFLFVADQHRGDAGGYSYAVRDEQRLIALANKGRMDALQAELDGLYQRNFVEMKPGVFMQRLLYARMLSTLALSDDLGAAPDDLEARFSGLSGRAFFAALASAYAAWCDASLRRLERGQNQLIQNVLDHIHAHYREDALGLASVALHFGVTESHLSGFFKEKVGKTFSAYLETVRIQEANRRLLTTQCTIDEIARQVGYANADSFRRAYRRVHGYTPSQHRNAAL